MKRSSAEQAAPSRSRIAAIYALALGCYALLALAYDANPDNPPRVIGLADLYMVQGNTWTAINLHRRAAEMEHRRLYVQAMRALTAAALDDPAEPAATLRATDDYRRSGNNLLEWAWNAQHTSAPSRVVPGDPAALGFYAGFAPATPGLAVGCWTLGEGRVRVRVVGGVHA